MELHLGSFSLEDFLLGEAPARGFPHYYGLLAIRIFSIQLNRIEFNSIRILSIQLNSSQCWILASWELLAWSLASWGGFWPPGSSCDGFKFPNHCLAAEIEQVN